VPSAPFFIALVALTIWLYLFLARGNFWNLRPFDDDEAAHPAPPTWPTVTAIIPARNEAETIAQTIASITQQNYPGKFSIVLVDDHSEDTTAKLAQESAQANHANSNAVRELTILAAPPLQSGWTGKLSALNAGIQFALDPMPEESPPSTQNAPSTQDLSFRGQRGICFSSASPQNSTHELPTYLWFTDADIVHAPDTLTRLVSRAERHNLDLASLMVLLRAQTLPERFLIPPFLFFFLMLYPPRKIASSKSRVAGAAGGCILLRRDALDRIGGLAVIRSEVIDDCALARAVKRSRPEGQRANVWMGVTHKSRSLRAYTTFTEIRDMIARTAFTQLRYSALLLIGTLLGLAITYLAPIALLFAHDTLTRVIALATWLVMSLLFLPTVRFYRISTHWSATLPAAAAFYAAATFLSAIRYWTNRGAQWKGRSQAPK
jgi:cellulose synthase/poly-beta-1,6-N-acetylglucosamine synthase-like glycosyltransferase